MSGVKSVSIEGYNFGTSEKDIRFVTVKGGNCSHTRLVSSQSIVCLLTHLTAEDTVDANDVTLSTVSSETTGVHLQPLTIARGRSRRAVMSKISTTSFPFVPYGVAYPVVPSSQTEEVSRGGTYVYWSDIGARRLYRCLVDGSALEVVLTDVSTGAYLFQVAFANTAICHNIGAPNLWSSGCFLGRRQPPCVLCGCEERSGWASPPLRRR